MALIIMSGKYSAAALKDMSPARTQQVVELIKKYGGEVLGMYATLGPHDLVFILNLPGVAQAMQVSVALSKFTGIAFSTSPAIPVAEFDDLMSSL